MNVPTQFLAYAFVAVVLSPASSTYVQVDSDAPPESYAANPSVEQRPPTAEWGEPPHNTPQSYFQQSPPASNPDESPFSPQQPQPPSNAPNPSYNQFQQFPHTHNPFAAHPSSYPAPPQHFPYGSPAPSYFHANHFASPSSAYHSTPFGHPSHQFHQSFGPPHSPYHQPHFGSPHSPHHSPHFGSPHSSFHPHHFSASSSPHHHSYAGPYSPSYYHSHFPPHHEFHYGPHYHTHHQHTPYDRPQPFEHPHYVAHVHNSHGPVLHPTHPHYMHHSPDPHDHHISLDHLESVKNHPHHRHLHRPMLFKYIQLLENPENFTVLIRSITRMSPEQAQVELKRYTEMEKKLEKLPDHDPVRVFVVCMTNLISKRQFFVNFKQTLPAMSKLLKQEYYKLYPEDKGIVP